jgi:hypothetical protein
MVVGCTTTNPLAGWKPYFHEPDQKVTSDYQGYIQKLPPEERQFAGMIQYYEDGMGHIAIEIQVPLNGRCWEHILIYDKDNNRVKTIKYMSGHYRS